MTIQACYLLLLLLLSTYYRYTGNDLYVVQGTFQVPLHIVEKYKFFYYKYVVVTRQTNGLQFEHIWNATSRKWNGCRCLDIPVSEKKPRGGCIHYEDFHARTCAQVPKSNWLVLHVKHTLEQIVYTGNNA